VVGTAEATAKDRYGLLLLLSSAAIVTYRLYTMRKPAEKPCEPVPIHIGSDGFAANYLEELNVPIPTTSGIDPNDPEWTPPGGWHYLFNFNDPLDIAFAFSDLTDNYAVEGGVFGWNLPPGDWGYAQRRYYNKSWTRAAVCLKIRVDNVVGNVSDIIYFNPITTTDRSVGVGFHVVAGSQTLKIKDWNSGGGSFDPPLYDFTPPDDWIVIVVDNTPGQTPYIRIYDRNKNVLFSLDLITSSYPLVLEDIWLQSENDTRYGIWDIKIDWIAFRY
jgi:hypothetical protein